MKRQKFHRGNLVKIADDLGPTMSHFESGCEAIIMGSYDDQYGGGDTDEYTVMFVEDGNTCSWYHENQLTLIDKGGEHLIAQATKARDECERVQTQLPWIVENWKSFGEKIPGVVIAELMHQIGIHDPWGPRGEGVTYYANAMGTFELLKDALGTGDLTTVQKRIAEVRARTRA